MLQGKEETREQETSRCNSFITYLIFNIRKYNVENVLHLRIYIFCLTEQLYIHVYIYIYIYIYMLLVSCLQCHDKISISCLTA